MRKLLGLALLLGVVQLIAGSAVTVQIFRKVDLRFQALLAMIVIPLFQAFVLLWVRRDGFARPMRDALHSLRNRALLVLLVLDAAVLCVSFGMTPALARALFGVHAFAAALALLFTMHRIPGPRRWLVAVTAAGLALYGLSFFTNWLAMAPRLVDDGRTIVRWIVAYIPLFVVAVLGMLAAAWALEKRATRAAGWVDIATALFVLAAIVVASNIFFHPSLTPAWRVVHRVLAYTTVTAMLLASVAILTERTADAP